MSSVDAMSLFDRVGWLFSATILQWAYPAVSMDGSVLKFLRTRCEAQAICNVHTPSIAGIFCLWLCS